MTASLYQSGSAAGSAAGMIAPAGARSKSYAPTAGASGRAALNEWPQLGILENEWKVQIEANQWEKPQVYAADCRAVGCGFPMCRGGCIRGCCAHLRIARASSSPMTAGSWRLCRLRWNTMTTG